ncbi:hypothetical protein BLA29_013257 [Euroglyphus maynei]|uniref:Uncharacterized protein n=1 Tax=Euroglyphus maynei TaxID=6958 RepID=A0A1Y3AKU9_EURMA|nr:hypothetical protein BLA29_013257 [Euroglyphus maynei]
MKSLSSSDDSQQQQQEQQQQQSATGFDGVVRQDRQRRQQTFGPNAKKIRKPNNILIDIYGVIAPWTFVNQLKTYAKENIDDYWDECGNRLVLIVNPV